jgi:hypothetical protein
MEYMVITQARAGYGDVTKAFGAEDDIPEIEGGPDELEKCIADSHLRGVGINAERFHAQVAHIGQRAAQIYRKIAEAAGVKAPAPAEDPQSLNKRFTKSEKAHHIQKSANGKWQMEYASDGRLIRGYEIEGAS